MNISEVFGSAESFSFQLEEATKVALQLARQGIPVFPIFPPAFEGGCTCRKGMSCDSPGKHPIFQGGHNNASSDPALVERWAQHARNTLGHSCNWGVTAGDTLQGSLCVIDLDGEEGVASWKKALQEANLSAVDPMESATLQVKTSKGGLHIYLLGQLKQSVGVLPGVDTRGNGKGYVVTPGSIHVSGHIYTATASLDTMSILPLDSRIKDFLERRMAGEGAAAQETKQPVSGIIASLLNGEEVVAEGGRNDRLFRAAASCRARNLTLEEARVIIHTCNRTSFNPPLEDGEVETIITGVYSRYPAGAEAARTSTTPTAPQAGEEVPENWRDALIFTTNQKSNVRSYARFCENLLRTLNFCPVWRGRFRYNLEAKQVEEVSSTGSWSRITSGTALQFRRFIEVELSFTPSIQDCEAAILEAAHGNEVSPLKDSLLDSVWDGVERLPNLLQKYLGVEDSELNREFFVRHMIASVARVLSPGCQHDVMLVLQGAQGIRKSSMIRALYGDAHFTDQASLADCSNKDNLGVLVSRWAIEFPELSGMKKGDVEGIKKFITSREDTFRPPYGRHLETHPRTCVLWGTTNESHPLMDPTGNRRFHILHCTRKMSEADIREIEELRPQLWAEAVERYGKGDRWWFKEGEESHLIEQSEVAVAAHVEESPLVDRLVSFFDSAPCQPLRAVDLLAYCSLPPTARSYSVIKSALANLSVEQQTVRVNGVKTRVYVPAIHKDNPKHAILSLENKLSKVQGEKITVTLDDLEAEGFRLPTRMHVNELEGTLRECGWSKHGESWSIYPHV